MGDRTTPDDQLSDDERRRAAAELNDWASYYEELARLALHAEPARRMTPAPPPRGDERDADLRA